MLSTVRATDKPLGLRAARPLISPAGDLDGEAPGAEGGDDQPTTRVGGIRLGMAWRTERPHAVEIEVGPPLGAFDDVVDLEGAPVVEDSAGATLNDRHLFDPREQTPLRAVQVADTLADPFFAGRRDSTASL